LGLLQEVLLNQIQPAGLVLNEKGMVAGSLPLQDGRFKAETTEMIRFYAVLGSIVSQDVDGMEAKDNASRLFRVMSGFQASTKAQSVVRPGTARDDEDQLKYWAPAEALAAQGMVEHLSNLEQVRILSASLAADFKQVLDASLAVEKAQAESKTEEELQVLKAAVDSAMKTADLKLSALRESVGSRSSKEFIAVYSQIQSVARALEQASSKLGQREFALILDLRRTQVSSILIANPAMAAAMQPLAEDEKASAFVRMLLNGVSLESQQSTVFGNLETLNRLMTTLHPELRR
jgi:hypothetical protein